jgi:predicted nucleotide-binding protein
LTAELADRDDEYLRTLRKAVEDLKVATARNFVALQMPGRVMSRDPRATEGGFEAAVHQEVLATVAATRATFATADDLATMADRAAVHIERLDVRVVKRVGSESIAAQRAFIGHGHSPVWRELKDFIQDRLLSPWDEFNRVPVAGVTNIARLSDMLDAATISFHILTAEDERADGAVMARQNVIHEAGLFQGRLGFTRAIIVLEEGCEEFTNIEGLGQIRFPPGRISAAFEEVRRVLEREGIVRAPDVARITGAV